MATISDRVKHIYLPILLGLLLVAPSLWNGLQLDDYYHWGLITDNALAIPAQANASLFGLFSFIDGQVARTQLLMDQGMVPWWTLPELQYAFWRPLSELTHAIDYLLWPQQPWLMHFHSIIYLLLIYILAQRLLSVWLTGKALHWAFWIFCLSYTHGFATGWLANRNALLASLFSLLCVYFHDRWRACVNATDDSRRSYRLHLFAWLSFAAALLSGELGVSAGLLLLAYALTMEPAGGSLFKRLLSISSYAALGILWLIARAALGYGAQGSGHYVAPDNLTAFVPLLLERYLRLIAGLLGNLPPELGYATLAMIFGGLLSLLLGVAVILVRPWRVQPVSRFFLLAASLSLLPLCATEPHSRLLLLASLPMAGWVGCFLAARSQPYSTALPWLVKLVSGYLLVMLLAVSPLLKGLESVLMKLMMNGMLNNGAMTLQINSDEAQQRIHLLLNPPSAAAAGYVQGVRAYQGLPVAKAVLPLSSGVYPVDLRVTSPQSFRLQSDTGLYLTQENLLRSNRQPLQVGEVIELAALQIEVLAMNAAQLPSQIEVRLRLPLEAYQLHLWHGGQPVPCVLPAVGRRLELTQQTASCD